MWFHWLPSLFSSFLSFFLYISKLKGRTGREDTYWHLATETWGGWSPPGGQRRFFTRKWTNAPPGIHSGEIHSSKNTSTRVDPTRRKWKGRLWPLVLSIWQNRGIAGESASAVGDCLYYTRWCEKIHLNCGLDHSLGFINGKRGQAAEWKQFLLLSDSQWDVISCFSPLLPWLPAMMDLQLWAS